MDSDLLKQEVKIILRGKNSLSNKEIEKRIFSLERFEVMVFDRDPSEIIREARNEWELNKMKSLTREILSNTKNSRLSNKEIEEKLVNELLENNDVAVFPENPMEIIKQVKEEIKEELPAKYIERIKTDCSRRSNSL